ncbi:hypothetical protein SK128_020265, partial [Halocaridina rubra]
MLQKSHLRRAYGVFNLKCVPVASVHELLIINLHHWIIKHILPKTNCMKTDNGCEDGWGGIKSRSALSIPRQIVHRDAQASDLIFRRASLSYVGTAMLSSSREKSPMVSKVLSKISSDSKVPKHQHGEHTEDSKEPGCSADPPPCGKDPKSPKAKKNKRSIFHFRGHKSGKKSEKEKEKLKKEKSEVKGRGEGEVSPLLTANKEKAAQLPELVETDEVETPQLVTKDADAISSKELSEIDSVTVSDVTEPITDIDCLSEDMSDFSDKCSESLKSDAESEDLINFKTYSALHTTRTTKYESPLKKTQIYQKSFLHNRFGSNSSMETLPGRLDRVPSGSSSISSVSSFSTLAALRCRTLDSSYRHAHDGSGQSTPITHIKSSTLDTVRARFHNHVNNLTYEGMSFTSGEQSPSSSSLWSLGGKGFTSPFSKFGIHSSDSKNNAKEKEKKSKISSESKFTAKSGVKKILLSNRLKEETSPEVSPERKSPALGTMGETKKKVDPVSKNLDSITIISNKNVTAKLNITLVKTPEMARKSELGSFRFARTGIRSSVRTSQKKKKAARSPPSSSPPPSTDSSSSSIPYKMVKTVDGKIIPEYAKVNKRKNSKPDIVDEGHPESITHGANYSHESPVEKAPVVKKIEAAAYKARKDNEPSLKVNPVKRAESFKTGSRVCRKSSLTYVSRTKMFKEGLDPESFVKTQAVKLRRKDSKNGRIDMRNARRAEYRLSVTIKPSTVATLTNKFNTIISQNQAGNSFAKAEFPVGHVSLHETRVTRSPKPNVRFKNRTKMGRNYTCKEKFKEGTCLLDEKSIKEEKNREEKRGDFSVPSSRKANSRTSRSPSPKKISGKSGSSLLEKLGDNKTDEEKVCEKIKTALSSAKFKGETDDSEDDVVDQDTTAESKYKVSSSSHCSPATNAESGAEAIHSNADGSLDDAPQEASTSADSTVPKILKSPEKSPRSNLRDILAKISERNKSHYAEIDDAYPIPERHSKTDSMDSGISTEEHISGAGSISIGNTTLLISSVPSYPTSSQEDSSLETVVSNDTVKSEDSAVALNSMGCKERDILFEGQETIIDSVSEHNNVEKGIVDTLESEEKGAIDILESEERKPVDVIDATHSEETEINSIDVESQSTSSVLESASASVVEDLDDKAVDADARSLTSSCMDDTHSEVSSVCSEAKPKKSSRGNENRIYTAVKTAVKNTVKKTKEKDAERKEEKEKEKRNRSPSADRDKWYRRGRSKERRRDKKASEKDQEVVTDKDEADEDCSKREQVDSPKKDCKEKESRTYERFTFRKLREKSQERRKNREKNKEEELKKKGEERRISEESRKEPRNKKKEKEKEETTNGMFTLRSRSRSRDCSKKNKEKYLEDINIKHEPAKDIHEASPSPTTDSVQHDSPAVASQTEQDSTSTACPFLNKNKKENLVFTFDTESIYDKPLTPKISSHTSKSKTLPPPPKTPIPSPPSSATPLPPPPNTPIPDPPIESPPHSATLLPPPPNTPIPDPPIEVNSEAKSKELSQDCEVQSNGDSDSLNETENIYENLYAPNLEKLHRNREKLEGRGIKPNSSFLWSDGVPASAVTETPRTETIIEDGESHTPFAKITGVKTCGKGGRYGKISPSSKSKDSTGPEGHNYAELQPTNSDDTHTVSYDDIGAASAVSYDDISAPSSCGYDDIGTSSSTGYDTIKPPSEGYDPVNPPRSDSSQYDDCDGGIVTAQLAVVREDQLDSISYYDDISMYNASQSSHSYEPVYPPGVSPQGRPGVSSIKEVPEADTAIPSATPIKSVLNAKETGEEAKDDSYNSSQGDSEDGVHEVFSYKLTRMGGALESSVPVPSPSSSAAPSTPGSTIHTRIY